MDKVTGFTVEKTNFEGIPITDASVATIRRSGRRPFRAAAGRHTAVTLTNLRIVN
jgi:hypothetical protein